MKEKLSEIKLIISRRQPKNLKRILTRAEFVDEHQSPSVSKCGESRCGTCELILTGKELKLSNGKKWIIKSDMNCKSRDIIYVITCRKCDSFYVGTTENLRKRVTLHKEQIKPEKYRHLAVRKHIHRYSGGLFNIMPIYECANSTRLHREAKEQEIIKTLNPDLNRD